VAVNYAFLKELVSLAEEYEVAAEGRAPSSADFAAWILMRGAEPAPDKHIGDRHMVHGVRPEQTETAIARMVIYMYRYAKAYTKKALEGSPLQTADEFGYLATLLSFDQLKKSELISLNVQEKPTGMEVIKRLLAAGLIDQLDDETDKRSKLLRINNKGKGVLFQLFARMGKVSELVGGELAPHEKQLLLHLLRKLDDYHHDIFLNRKEEVLGGI